MSEAETRKCSDCKEEYPLFMFRPVTYRKPVPNRPISRCIDCRIARHTREDTMSEGIRKRMLAERGFCSVRDCANPRIKTSEYCINHFGTDEDPAGPAKLIRLYSLRCIFCSWYTYGKGTAEQARITMLLGKVRCKNCNGLLEMVDEGQIVGRIYATDQREAVPAAGTHTGEVALVDSVPHVRQPAE